MYDEEGRSVRALSKLAIVGVVIGGIVFVAMVVIACLIWRKVVKLNSLRDEEKLREERSKPLGYRLFIDEHEIKYRERSKQLANLFKTALSDGDIRSTQIDAIAAIDTESGMYCAGENPICSEDFILEPGSPAEMEIVYIAFLNLFNKRETAKTLDDSKAATKEFRNALGLKKPTERDSLLMSYDLFLSHRH